MPVNVDIAIEGTLWKQEDSSMEEKITSIIHKVFTHKEVAISFPADIEIEISILLTNNKKIQELNKNYRQKDQATNVLSFPTISPSEFQSGNLPTIDNFLAIGDIVLSFETIKEESLTQKKIFSNHLTHLIVHSILHLMSYDHLNEKDANIMESLEIDILKKLDIDDPYNI